MISLINQSQPSQSRCRNGSPIKGLPCRLEELLKSPTLRIFANLNKILTTAKYHKGTKVPPKPCPSDQDCQRSRSTGHHIKRIGVDFQMACKLKTTVKSQPKNSYKTLHTFIPNNPAMSAPVPIPKVAIET